MVRELRFGVGAASGPRSNTWTIKGQRNDVYLMQRRVGGTVKVSLHEEGPWRFALTSEHLASPDRLQVPEGADPRMARAWSRPSPIAQGLTRAFAVVVPWFEIIDRPGTERAGVVWADTPPQGSSVQCDVFLAGPTAKVDGHPGAGSMGTQAVGDFELPNGDRVFVVWWAPKISESIQQQLDRLLSAEVLDDGHPVSGLSMLAFLIEDGVGAHIDVTLPDVTVVSRRALLDGEARCPRCAGALGEGEDRATLVDAISRATSSSMPVKHVRCGQVLRVRLED
jgi:hypothetical protein